MTFSYSVRFLTGWVKGHAGAIALLGALTLIGGAGGFLVGRDWNWLMLPRFRGPAVLDCQGEVPDAVNNMHSALAIVGGTDAFAGVGSAHKDITARPGSLLQGEVRIHVAMHAWPAFRAEMIGTPSWGNPRTSFWRVAWTAPSTKAAVSLNAPAKPGVYHIIFAMQLEMYAVSVASATNWEYVIAHGPDWNPATEIAAWRRGQIADAQLFGCAVAAWRGGPGGQPHMVAPADAITVTVR